MENGGGVIVKTMVRSGVGTRPLGGAAIPSDLFINTLLPPLGRRSQRALTLAQSLKAGGLLVCLLLPLLVAVHKGL